MRLFTMSCALILCSQAYAFEDTKDNLGHVAIQGVLVTGGNLGIGLAYYTERTEIGVTGSASINNAHEETQIFTPDVFAELRKNITNHTYAALGLDLGTIIGHQSGETIKGALSVLLNKH
ncbi:MAG: hypothetical protein ACRCXC_13555 [Legionella sp.]